jgi:uncharacterized membrane protein
MADAHKHRFSSHNYGVYRTLAAIGFMLCVGVWLRWIDISTESLWTDELYSLHWSGKQVQQILANAAADVHPPTYYILLHWWTQCFGTSEAALRGLSVLFGVLALPLMYLLGSALLGTRAGLAAAWMLAVSHFHVYYSQEARNYTLVVFCSVWSMHAFWFILRRMLEQPHTTHLSGNNPGEHRAQQEFLQQSLTQQSFLQRFHYSFAAAALYYVLATIVLMHTHLFALFVVVAQNAAVCVLVAQGLWNERNQPEERSKTHYKTTIRRWIILQSTLLVLFLPWLNILMRQILSVGRQGFWIEEPTAFTLAETFAEYAGGYWLLIIMGALTLWGGYCLWTGKSMNIQLISKARLAEMHEVHTQPHRELLALRIWILLLWLALPIAIPLIKSFLSTPSIYYIKYTIPALPAFLLLVVAGWSEVSSRVLRWCLLVSIILLSLQAVQEEWTTLNKERWRETAMLLDAIAAPDDGIIVHQWYYTWALEYYCHKPHSLQGVPSQYLQWKPEIIEHLVDAATHRRNRVWLVLAQRDARFSMIIKTLVQRGFEQNKEFGTKVIPSFYRKYFVRDEYDEGQIVISLLKTYQTPYIQLICFDRVQTPAH